MPTPTDRRAARAKVPAPAVYRLEIPAIPPSLNQLMRGTIKARIRIGKAWRLVVAFAFARHAHIPAATGRRRVSLTVTLPGGQRAPDPDNIHKALADALTHCGAIRGDSYKWIEWGSVVFWRGPMPRTVVILEDVPAARIEWEPSPGA
jgi:Holliday junction resolvase RusA-like endonuclease